MKGLAFPKPARKKAEKCSACRKLIAGAKLTAHYAGQRVTLHRQCLSRMVGDKRSKFGNRRAQSLLSKGRSFDSQGERDCFEMLKAEELAGRIRDLRCQVSVYLGEARYRYIADFEFFDVELGETIWGDFKGHEQPRWRDTVKQWRAYGPGRLRVWKKARDQIVLVKEIMGRSKV